MKFNHKAFAISAAVVALIGLICIFAGAAVWSMSILTLIVGIGYGIIFGIALRGNDNGKMD